MFCGMNAATRMSPSVEVPFLKVLPPPTPHHELPALPGSESMAEKWRVAALRQLQEYGANWVFGLKGMF